MVFRKLAVVIIFPAGIWGCSIVGAPDGSRPAAFEPPDRADLATMERVTRQALDTAPNGLVVSWNSADSGHYGTVTPTRDYWSPAGEACRDYVQTVTIGGQSQRNDKTACRQADRSWKIVK